MSIENKRVPSGIKYLSEFITELPSKVLFNKGITGCGGTTVELVSERNSIILVPTKNLVENKSQDYEILGVKGDITNDAIKSYLLSDIKWKKIIATYDALPRLINLLGDNIFKDYFLLVDEYHILFNSYGFRNKAIRKVLNLFLDFNDYCFMTATPLNEMNILHELSHLDVLNLDWEDKVEVKVEVVNKTYLIKELKDRIRDSFLRDYNLHIFINSVKSISSIIKALKLKDYRIICSDNSKIRIKHLNTSSINSEVKKINFYTSTAFEGVDIYDPVGKTIIISDTNIATTLLDISTLFIQICGRLRDSIYKDQVTFIFNSKNYKYYEENFYNKVDEAEKYGKYIVDKFNSDPDPEYKSSVLRTYSDKYLDNYVILEDDKIIYDFNLKKIDIQNYDIINNVYNSKFNVLKELHENDISIIDLDPLYRIEKNEIDETALINDMKAVISEEYYTFSELKDLFTPIFKDYGIEYKRTSARKYLSLKTKSSRVDGKSIKLYKII